ncbi:MAG: C4-type zinc ribbon domain-containing protein [Deferrisomatales bacterium]|nr:C4-type zinc ribbon domain-containing protein [Deferrisomatales bacterium]
MEADVLGLLETLQEVADEIDRLEARRREATQGKEQAEETLHKAEGALGEKEGMARAMDMERRKRELVLKSEKDRMARVKGRLGDVKTSREYQAVLQEIASAKQTITEQEEAQLREMQELETMESEIEALRGTIQGMAQALQEAERALSQVLGQTEAAVAERKEQEATILKSLPREVVDRYRLIRSRRGGLAVVPARNEACTACFMRIPPQMYNEVMRRSKVIQCPNCHRILVPAKVAAEV